MWQNMRTGIWLPIGMIMVGLVGCSTPVNLDSQANTPVSGATSASSAAPFDYSDYATALKEYVTSNGRVDYAKLKANRQQLDRFNAAIAAVTPQTYQAWSEADRLAFLINAYNSLTLASIIDKYPVKSIRDIPGVWKGRKFTVAGLEVTLDDIEHNTIRKSFNEPRIHVAINCASIGCPILRNEPYIGSKLDQQLADQTRAMLANSDQFRLDRTNNKVYVSSVFKWFGEDFEKTYGQSENLKGLNKKETAFMTYIGKHLPPEDQQFIQQGGYKVEYLDWDWSLNAQA